MTGPRYSLVCPVYDVARYLPDFLDGLDAQDLDHGLVEVLLVDDGSRDGSGALARAWADGTDYDARVLHQPNGGLASARNLGLSAARGEWITFPDPDDVLEPDYLTAVDRALADAPDVHAVVTRLLMREDATGELEDTHPLRHRFGDAPRAHRLRAEPAYFFLSSAASFVRRQRVVDLGLQFDPAIRPNFEDGHLNGRYLLAEADPWVLFAPGARYHYRRRADGSSAIQRSLGDPDRWTTVLERGYLDLLERAAASGPVPAWLQQVVVYDISWLLVEPARSIGDATPAVRQRAAELHALMTRICGHLDPTVVAGCRAARNNGFVLAALTQGWRTGPQGAAETRSGHGRLTHPDSDQGLVRLGYWRSGPPGVEEVRVAGAVARPAYSTSRPFAVLGRLVATERLLWVPLEGPVELRVGGEVVPVQVGPRAAAALPATTLRARAGATARRALRRGLRDGTGGAWVLMDRVHEAGDNAQRLFEHLRDERRDVDAYFVVLAGTPSWDALRREHGDRVVAHGSDRWRELMGGARHLLTSHADPWVVRPEAVVAPGRPAPWRTTFLQHGVTKDDISRWLNQKTFDLFVTSAVQERDDLLDPEGPWVYTEREVVLTGMPRFDRLHRLASPVAPADRDLLLVCPTWRRWFGTDQVVDGMRQVDPTFPGSEYARRWSEALGSPELHEVARDLGLTVAFLPHPHLERAAGELLLPPHVHRFGYVSDDVQRLLARARVVVTDYSSTAFDAAYVDRPVVYHQFDRDRVLGGDHIGRPGWFDYDRDGFGPVVGDVAGLVEAVGAAAAAGTPGDDFAARARRTFVPADGRCCERVVAAVEASTRRVPRWP